MLVRSNAVEGQGHGFLTGTSIVTSLPEIGSKTVSVIRASGRSSKDAGGMVNEGLSAFLNDRRPGVMLRR